jgi:hypothetical protein
MSGAVSPGDVRLAKVVLHRAAAAANSDRDGHLELTDAVKEWLGLNASEQDISCYSRGRVIS